MYAVVQQCKNFKKYIIYSLMSFFNNLKLSLNADQNGIVLNNKIH